MNKSGANRSGGLGKGLSALMGELTIPTASLKSGEANYGPQELALESIQAGAYQPRKNFSEESLSELADSIRKSGVMQPILVREITAGRYEIIAGERRFRASKLANKTTVPAIIRSFTDQQALEFALIENIQRADLTPIEEALGYKRLMDEFAYTQEKLAESLGKSRPHVANMLRLLQLPETVQRYIEEGKLSVGHARALVAYHDPIGMAEQVIQEGLSVRALEKRIQEEKSPAPKAAAPSNAAKARARQAPAPYKDAELAHLEEQATEALGMQVTIAETDHGGAVTIQYTTLEQLDTILQCLHKKAVEREEALI
jgi:ParB family chromosome partitioning protein